MVLFQFPVSFKFTKKGKAGELIRFEGNWDHVADVLNEFEYHPKAIEFRHVSWDDGEVVCTVWRGSAEGSGIGNEMR